MRRLAITKNKESREKESHVNPGLADSQHTHFLGIAMLKERLNVNLMCFLIYRSR